MVCAGSACRRRPPAPEQRYELKGKVASVDTRGRTVTIAHEAIEGYMDAMAMPFKLKDEWAFDEMAAGDRVQATLVVSGDRSWLEGVVFVRESPDTASASPKFVEPRPGDEVPGFTLTNQDGNRIRLDRYRGRALVLTFIYTRCPLPDYCPLMTRRFGEIMAILKDNPALAEKTHLLSVTVDPDYDKPAVLREYARASAGLDTFDRWEFASGGTEEVKKVATFFGMQYWQEDGQIIHSLRTAVIGPEGKLAALYRGSDWKAEEIISNLQSLNLN
ncbi:MAG TPA: SCO family protein [Blastocatellia bacterium]|nr:SCO family protein [Blastocatellia bacterium]